MDKPAIAVVIPAYNADRFLNEAVESVCAQTTPRWECMIVNDGSTDETSHYLAALRDPRIRWVRQINSGESSSRARGVSMTSAPKVVFLDADDQLYPDTLARYLNFLDKHGTAGVVYGERTLINEEGNGFGLERGAVLNKHPEGDVLESILRRPFLSTPSQACFRREAVPPVEWLGTRTPLGDWLLLAGAAINNTFSYVGRAPLVKYRVRRNSVMRSFASNPQSATDIREFNEVLDRLFSLPGLESRFGLTKLAELRRSSEATCFAIKGQEFLRHNEPGAARHHFSAAFRCGSRDCRDLLCWASTFSPALLRWMVPLYGRVYPQR